MFFIVGTTFLALLSLTLIMLWGHERTMAKNSVPRAKIEECWKDEERREHLRFKTALAVDYNVAKKPHIKNGKTVDMSKGGMKLLLDEKLPKGAIVSLKVHMPGNKQAAEVEAEVAWTKECDVQDPSGKRFFYSGIKFIAVSGLSVAYLHEHLAYLESENP